MELYHGSDKIVERPVFGAGNPFNDYGLGFYCTQEIALAREWACTDARDGFVNKYELDTDGLRILNLNAPEFTILHWLAVLLENRRFDLSTPVAVQAREFLLKNYLPEYKDFDIITGYRADDSYFSFSRAFLSNGITLEQLSRAMKLGKLGEQVVIRSEATFARLRFLSSSPVDAGIYHPKRMSRDRDARSAYLAMIAEPIADESVFVSDLIHGKSL